MLTKTLSIFPFRKCVNWPGAGIKRRDQNMHMYMYLLGHAFMENDVRKFWARPGSAQAGSCAFPHKVLWAHIKCSGSRKEPYLTQDRVRIFQQLYVEPAELSDTAHTVHLRPHLLQTHKSKDLNAF